jgi:hypothetical protein
MHLSPKELFLIAHDTNIQEYIKENLHDPWVGTPFANYRYLDNKQKGMMGEIYVKKIFENCGYKVSFASTSTAGHDLVINDILTEVKFSLAHTDHKKKQTKHDEFIMNHVALGKNWERLIFIGVNRDDMSFRAKYMTKKLFRDAIKKGHLFSVQQGGKHGGNDDYIISSKKLRELMNSNYMKDLNEW